MLFHKRHIFYKLYYVGVAPNIDYFYRSGFRIGDLMVRVSQKSKARPAYRSPDDSLSHVRLV